MRPRVVDNDKDEITVSLDGSELRGWSYATEDERRQKMLQAREYIEGWCDGSEAARAEIERLHNGLQQIAGLSSDVSQAIGGAITANADLRSILAG